MTSTHADSLIPSCDISQFHTSTTSSDQVEIHISGAFQDVGPPYIGEGLMASVRSLHGQENPRPMHPRPRPHIRLMAYDSGSGIPDSPISWGFSSTVDNVLRASNARTTATLDRGGRSGSRLLVSSGHSSIGKGKDGTAGAVCTPLKGPLVNTVVARRVGLATTNIPHDSARLNQEASERWSTSNSKKDPG